MPRGGDQQEDCGACYGVELLDSGNRAAAAAGCDEVQGDDSDREDEADQALSENSEGAAGGEAEAGRACRLRLLVGEPVAEDGEGETEADHRVGDGDAGEDEDSEARERDEGGVESGAGACEGAAGEGLAGEREGEDGEGERDARGRGSYSEDLHAGGHRPVEERGFLEVADSVGVERRPVVAQEHLAGDLGVDGVGVVEQWWREQGEAGVEEEPEQDEEESVAVDRRELDGHVVSVWSARALS